MPSKQKTSAKETKSIKASKAEKPAVKEDPTPKKPKSIEEIQAEAIYSLKLHESCLTNSGHRVTRVPGGWIYLTMDSMAGEAESVFVPFSDEFKG